MADEDYDLTQLNVAVEAFFTSPQDREQRAALAEAILSLKQQIIRKGHEDADEIQPIMAAQVKKSSAKEYEITQQLLDVVDGLIDEYFSQSMDSSIDVSARAIATGKAMALADFMGGLVGLQEQQESQDKSALKKFNLDADILQRLSEINSASSTQKSKQSIVANNLVQWIKRRRGLHIFLGVALTIAALVLISFGLGFVTPVLAGVPVIGSFFAGLVAAASALNAALPIVIGALSFIVAAASVLTAAIAFRAAQFRTTMSEVIGKSLAGVGKLFVRTAAHHKAAPHEVTDAVILLDEPKGLPRRSPNMKSTVLPHEEDRRFYQDERMPSAGSRGAVLPDDGSTPAQEDASSEGVDEIQPRHDEDGGLYQDDGMPSAGSPGAVLPDDGSKPAQQDASSEDADEFRPRGGSPHG